MLWILAFHVIAMVAWFAGLFYLPRLFVYHADVMDSTSHQRFVIMERRLYWGIMLPAALITTACGVYLLSQNISYYQTQGWMHVKLCGVLLLYAFHACCGYWLRAFKYGRNKRSSVFYRWANEVPTLLLLLIVIMVVVKP